MKKILVVLVFSLLFSSCGINNIINNEEIIKSGSGKILNKGSGSILNKEYAPVDDKLESIKTMDGLINLHNTDLGLVKEIYNYDGVTQNDEKRYFLDGYNVCLEISKLNLNNEDSKIEFLQFSKLKIIYDFVLKSDLKLNDYLDESGKPLIQYQLGGRDDKEDLIIALTFAGKIDNNKASIELKKLSKNYLITELSNSIILDVLSSKLLGNEITEDICKNKFKAGYKDVF